jgi:DNA replication and repair protein RecF
MPHITALTLTHFRNHAALRLDSDAPMLAIIGPNGAGKTNILEALSLFSPGRGLRGADAAEMLMDGADAAMGWGVQAMLADGTELATGWAGGRRQILVNGTAIPQADLRDHLAVLWLGPEDDFVLGNSARERRGLLDRWVGALDPVHPGRLQQLQKSMSERLRVLERGGRADAAWLTALERDIAERGTAVAAARLAFVQQLGPFLAALPDFPPMATAIVGEVEEALCRQPALQVEDAYAAALAAGRGDDAARGQTHYGAHRSDWAITHLAKGPAGAGGQPAPRCSTGEQKTLLFALLLASAALLGQATGRPPVILLDEALSHLDAPRRAQILTALSATPNQVWITGVETAVAMPNSKIIPL